MENYISIENQLSEMSDYKIIKKQGINLHGVLTSAIGILLLVIPLIISMHFGISIFLGIIGLTAIIIGLIKIIKSSSKTGGEYVYAPTGKKIKKFNLYYNGEHIQKLHFLLQNKDYSAVLKLPCAKDSGHILRIMGTKEGDIVLLQITEFIPYNYVATSPVYVLEGEDAKKMMSYVLRSGN